MTPEPIEIEKLDMSVRLKNCLRRNGISDLRDAVRIPKERFLTFRNMGTGIFEELQEQCGKYGIVIHSVKELTDKSMGIIFSRGQSFELFKMGIRSVDEIKTFPMEEMEKMKFSKPKIYELLTDAKRKIENEA